MNFWENAYKWGWADIDMLRFMVITDDMPFGEITKEDFERITGEPYDPVVEESTPEPVPEDETPAEDTPAEDPPDVPEETAPKK